MQVESTALVPGVAGGFGFEEGVGDVGVGEEGCEG